MNISITGIIYLKTSIHSCINRIKCRNRSGESNIEEDYLKKLDRCHNEWILDNNKLPTLILDGNSDFKNNPNELKLILNKIKNFIVYENMYEKIN